jgi:hypothetical protein
MIRKITKVSPYLAPLRAVLNPIAEIHDKGYIVDSDTVIAERQPDGRIRLKLKLDSTNVSP